VGADIDGEYHENIILNSGQDFLAHVDAADAEGDAVSYFWWLFETNGTAWFVATFFTAKK
jgi:hypothetical protein